MFKVLVFAALCGLALGQASSSDKILQFKADFQETVSISMPGMPSGMPGMPSGIPGLPSSFPVSRRSLSIEEVPLFNSFYRQSLKHGRFGALQGSFDTVVKGKLTYDYPNSRQRMDISSISMPMVGSQSLTGDNFEILRYDLGKNFTKVEGFTDGCLCNDLKGEIDTYFIPPNSNSQGQKTITINGENVVTTQYTYTFNMGNAAGSSDITVNFWIEKKDASTAYIRKFEFSTKMSAGGGGAGGIGDMTMNVSILFWNLSTLKNEPAATFKPDGCSCPAPPAPAAPPAEAKSATCASAAPGGCLCLSAAQKQGMPYCASYIDYPINPAIDPPSLDLFVQTAVSAAEMTGGSCSDLKPFLCKFYFMRCWTGGELYKPEDPPSCDAFKSSSAYDTYHADIKVSGSSSSTSAIVVSVFSVIVAAVATLFL